MHVVRIDSPRPGETRIFLDDVLVEGVVSAELRLGVGNAPELTLRLVAGQIYATHPVNVNTEQEEESYNSRYYRIPRPRELGSYEWDYGFTTINTNTPPTEDE